MRAYWRVEICGRSWNRLEQVLVSAGSQGGEPLVNSVVRLLSDLELYRAASFFGLPSLDRGPFRRRSCRRF